MRWLCITCTFRLRSVGDSQLIAQCLRIALRGAFIDLLNRMAEEHSNVKARCVFLINNYDAIVKVHEERKVDPPAYQFYVDSRNERVRSRLLSFLVHPHVMHHVLDPCVCGRRAERFVCALDHVRQGDGSQGMSQLPLGDWCGL